MTTTLDLAATDQPHLSELGIRALAALVANDIRPDWDTAGIASTLRAIAATTTPGRLVIAFVRGAVDQTNRTPAFIRYPNNRAWTEQRCTLHPSAGTRTDGECGGCHADRCGQPQPARFDRRPPTDEARQARAALHRPPMRDEPSMRATSEEAT